MEGEGEGKRGGGREREDGREKREREEGGQMGRKRDSMAGRWGRVESNLLNLAVMYSNFTIAYPPNELEFHEI